MDEKNKDQFERKFETQVLNNDVLSNLNLESRYKFLNINLASILNSEEMEFLREIEEFCLEYEKKVNHTEDLYEWYPDFGRKGYICRVHSFEEFDMDQSPYGLTADLVRHFGIEFFDTQFSWSIDASVLCLNPLHEHHDNVDVRVKALKELANGEAVGCVCITEPERGSDATHQLTVSKKTDDGFIINGVKAFNTNAPKSKYAIVYATAEQNNSKLMTQSLVEFPSDNVKIERVYIPAAPRVHLGKETFTNHLVPKRYIMGDIGQGRTHMFEGLVLERVGIAMCNIVQSWNALTHAAIYSNMREQMGKKIIRHQGVGFTLVDLWARTVNLTRSILDVCRSYDKTHAKFNGDIPPQMQRDFVTSASQLKYHCAQANVNTVYECMNLMGGAGVCDNLMIYDILGSSRVQEIVGGTRQIQQYIMARTLESILNKVVK
ncbi:MAG: hypothetical protein GF364_08100 [Candidatus Lokiarchaeota archaeon]|nr:hypothetical protein [Candidatus Lokiarchaeota archaeon]